MYLRFSFSDEVSMFCHYQVVHYRMYGRTNRPGLPRNMTVSLCPIQLKSRTLYVWHNLTMATLQNDSTNSGRFGQYGLANMKGRGNVYIVYVVRVLCDS